MRSPDGSELIGSHPGYGWGAKHPFDDLSRGVLKAFEAAKYTILCQKGVLLFVEGGQPRGLYMLAQGRVKLLIGSEKGGPRIIRISGSGEILGLSATLSGVPYEATAETLTPSRADFVNREDFLRLLGKHPDACFRVVELLCRDLHATYAQFSLIGESSSAASKLAKLLLGWGAKTGEETGDGIRLTVDLTHKEIAQMIGTSRETVTRLLNEFKHRCIISFQGPTLLIRERAVLEMMTKS